MQLDHRPYPCPRCRQQVQICSHCDGGQGDRRPARGDAARRAQRRRAGKRDQQPRLGQRPMRAHAYTN
jgi:hypothetical protein